MRCVRETFRISRALDTQSLACDFLRGGQGEPRLVEVSYCFPRLWFLLRCPGHWDSDMNWHEGQMWPEDAILDDLLKRLPVEP